MEKNNSNIIKGISISSIDVMKNFNARQDFGDIEELSRQISENGLLEPISVIPYFTEKGEERYMLVNGERRYRAMKLLEENGEPVGEIPARMISVNDKSGEDGLSEEEKKERANAAMADMYVQQYVRNAGKSFTDYETALLFKRLYDAGKTKIEIARALGKNPGMVTYYLNIFDWDPRVQDMIKNGEIGIMNCDRVLKANKKTYGDDYERHFTAELMRIHEKAVAKAEAEAADGESETKVKASLKDADMFGYVKATKEFVAGMRVLTQYFEEYSKNYPGLNVEIDPMLFFSILAKDGTKTLKNLFDEAVAQAQAKAV